MVSHAPLGPTRAERAALRVLQAGALAVVLAASLHRAYELDRFFVPKELVLHLTALAAGLLAVGAFRRAGFTRLDLLLAGYLALSAASALFAQNGWAALRALAVSVSGVAIFWAARGLREAGLARPLVAALALATVVGAATALLQAYGVRLDLFSVNRSPGGTLGNRNFVAHLAAFGLPVVFLAALRAWRTAGWLLGGVGVAISAAALVLTRSRAGWLAAATVLVVFLLAVPTSRALRGHGRTWLRLAGVLGFAAAGVAAAVLLPNALRWRSDNPYLESAAGVVEFREGSGAGRLVQYRRSLGMAAGRPLLGVGTGNWAVAYPAHAPAGDPSLDGTAPGTTSNPWPSSDWIAAASERGFAAALLLAAAMAWIGLGALRRVLAGRDADEALESAALLATVAAASVAGLFDAVLLLALPSLLVWAALGALWTPAVPADPAHARRGSALGALALAVLALAAGAGAVRSAAQLAAMHLHAGGELQQAARLDPGNYRVRLRLARTGPRDERCRHALAARDLYPSAAAARAAARGCD